PHPSWRSTAWLRRNPWFENELVPHLRTRVSAVLGSAAAPHEPAA
ncbi:uracil-DNA glycosylase family protein, partial [Mesorhizobium sp. M7A.F.Ca.US.006.04.2.1]